MTAKNEAARLTCETVARAACGDPRPGKPGDGAELYYKCLKHADNDPSLKVNLKKNAWMCGPCGTSGNAWDLAAFLLGQGPKWEKLTKPVQQTVTAWLLEHGCLEKHAGSRKSEKKIYPILREFLYRDENGEPIARRTRHDVPAEAKDERFRWWHLDPETGEWKLGFQNVNILPLYIGVPEPKTKDTWMRCSELFDEAGPLPWVVFTEGEHDTDTAAELGFVAVTSGGTSSLEILKRNLANFEDTNVVILTHPGAAGLKFAQEVAEVLHNSEAPPNQIKIVNLQESFPSAKVKDLAEFVEKYKKQQPIQDIGRMLQSYFAERPAWHPRIGADHLDAAYTYLRKFAKITEAQARILALYVGAAFVFDFWETTPYIYIYSAEAESGKSRIAKLLSAMFDTPKILLGPSLASLYGIIEQARELGERPKPIIIDEIDRLFNGRKENDNPIFAFLDGGFEPDSAVTRARYVKGQRDTEYLDSHCPKVLVGIDRKMMDSIILSRCILIRMEKKLPEDGTKKYVKRFHRAQGVEIGANLCAWAIANEERILRIDALYTPEFGDRAIDIWEPILAFAEAAGGNWLEYAKASLVELNSDAAIERDSIGVQALKSIRAAKAMLPDAKGVASQSLIEILHGMEGSPWAEYGRGKKPITVDALARILARHKIKPHPISIEGIQLKGYEWSQFEDAWKRHCRADSTAEVNGTGRVELIAGMPENQRNLLKPEILTENKSGSRPETGGGMGVNDVRNVKWGRISELRSIRGVKKSRGSMSGISTISGTMELGGPTTQPTTGFVRENSMLDRSKAENTILCRKQELR